MLEKRGRCAQAVAVDGTSSLGALGCALIPGPRNPSSSSSIPLFSASHSRKSALSAYSTPSANVICCSVHLFVPIVRYSVQFSLIQIEHCHDCEQGAKSPARTKFPNKPSDRGRVPFWRLECGTSF